MKLKYLIVSIFCYNFEEEEDMKKMTLNLNNIKVKTMSTLQEYAH